MLVLTQQATGEAIVLLRLHKLLTAFGYGEKFPAATMKLSLRLSSTSQHRMIQGATRGHAKHADQSAVQN
jgi:hypothetical protein